MIILFYLLLVILGPVRTFLFYWNKVSFTAKKVRVYIRPARKVRTRSHPGLARYRYLPTPLTLTLTPTLYTTIQLGKTVELRT